MPQSLTEAKKGKISLDLICSYQPRPLLRRVVCCFTYFHTERYTSALVSRPQSHRVSSGYVAISPPDVWLYFLPRPQAHLAI